MADFKETEFNSSVATLKRIDVLMMELHKAGFANNHPARLGLVRRLNVEGNEKLTGEEKKRCIKYESELLCIENGMCENKLGVNTYCTNPAEYRNKKNIEKWNRMLPIINSYELYVISCLDKHGMLMKNKQESDETPDSWED